MKRKWLIYFFSLGIGSCFYSQVDSINLQKKKIMTLQHSFSIGVINSNINYFQWDPYFDSYGNRRFKSDVLTDIDFSYSLNLRGFETNFLFKYQPMTYPFGNKTMGFLSFGYGRRYHHRFYFSFRAGFVLLGLVSVSNPVIHPCPPNTHYPCYDGYGYGHPKSILNLDLFYKIMKNKPWLSSGIVFQYWTEFYTMGKHSIGNSYLVFKFQISLLIFSKKQV